MSKREQGREGERSWGSRGQEASSAVQAPNVGTSSVRASGREPAGAGWPELTHAGKAGLLSPGRDAGPRLLLRVSAHLTTEPQEPGMKLRTRERAWTLSPGPCTQTALTKHAARRVCSVNHSSRNSAPSSGPERTALETKGRAPRDGPQADRESSRSLRGSPAERLALGRGKRNPPL